MTSFERGDAQVSMGGELRGHFRDGGPPGGEAWSLRSHRASGRVLEPFEAVDLEVSRLFGHIG
jgi:hypothetical protein